MGVIDIYTLTVNSFRFTLHLSYFQEIKDKE